MTCEMPLISALHPLRKHHKLCDTALVKLWFQSIFLMLSNSLPSNTETHKAVDILWIRLNQRLMSSEFIVTSTPLRYSLPIGCIDISATLPSKMLLVGVIFNLIL